MPYFNTEWNQMYYKHKSTVMNQDLFFFFFGYLLQYKNKSNWENFSAKFPVCREASTPGAIYQFIIFNKQL